MARFSTSSYNKSHISRRAHNSRINASQSVTLTCSCEKTFSLTKEWGADIGTMVLDLGKIFASSPLHVNMSACFDQYEILNVKLSFIDRGSYGMNDVAQVYHPIFFSIIDRAGTLDYTVTMNTLRSYSNYMETVMPNNTSLSPVQTRYFNYSSGSWTDTKRSCRLPKCIIGLYDPTLMYMNFMKSISVHMTATVRYRGVRRDIAPVMGMFYGAVNDIRNVF